MSGLQLILERLQFQVPSHQSRAARSAHARSGRRRALDRRFAAGASVLGASARLDGHRPHRLGQPLQRHRPEGPEPEGAPPADEVDHELTGQDLAAHGGVAQALGHDHGCAEEIGLFPDGFAGVDSDPQLKPRPLHRTLHGHGARQRGHGTRERNHEPVPEAFDLFSAGCRHRLTKPGEVAAA